MAMYLSSETIKSAVLNLKTAGTNSRLFAYLILRRLMVTNADENTGTIVLTGATCKPVTDEAALIGCGDNRYFNPLDANGASEGFLGERWWSNGPTDNINRWSTRSNMLERIKGVRPITIRVNEYDSATVPSFLQIRDDNRIDITDIAIWWFRNEDIGYLVEDGAVTCSALQKEFCKRLRLSDSECADLFAQSSESRVNDTLDVSEAVAIPKEYLPYSDTSTASEDSNDEDDLSLFDDNSDEIYTPRIDSQPRNLIFFGAPGTGKSYQLNKLGVRTKNNPEGLFPKGHVRRVTFYPDYTYSQFVGSYRPFTKEDKIGYHYIAGPFLKTCIEASTHPYDNYLLIIEELNRANPAAVFGDAFQLLDRDASGASEYYVSVPMEMAACIKESLDKLGDAEKSDIESYFDPDMDFDDFCESMLRDLSLPPNMYIWATMNSADQGVFPMDTAFKRRWDFRYMGIDEGENATPPALNGERLDKHVVNHNGARIVWNKVRKAINTLLLDCGVNEDKLLGPFFLSPEALSDEPYGDEGKSRFVAAFEDKVLLYLYEDAGKMRHKDIFRDGDATFADICVAFEHDGIEVFAQSTEKHRSIFADVFASVEDSDITDQNNKD